jgi:hypothetical protein
LYVFLHQAFEEALRVWNVDAMQGGTRNLRMNARKIGYIDRWVAVEGKTKVDNGRLRRNGTESSGFAARRRLVGSRSSRLYSSIQRLRM